MYHPILSVLEKFAHLEMVYIIIGDMPGGALPNKFTSAMQGVATTAPSPGTAAGVTMMSAQMRVRQWVALDEFKLGSTAMKLFKRHFLSIKPNMEFKMMRWASGA